MPLQQPSLVKSQPGSLSERNSIVLSSAIQGKQFFYQRGAQSNRLAKQEAGQGLADSPTSGDDEYSSGDEVETEGERQARLQKARAEILQRIDKYKATKWKEKAPSIVLPASKVKLFNNQLKKPN